ncbi:MAG: hypothetical protein GTN84_16835 [Hydrogenophaga sp.]|uniref:hypothetical protein n=1 Tax=Hydrogenophaga sp. TaxID=1904254 RepID=UPI0016B13602|nr:hypothetical protein [Hydrogenophaga sp.]NIM42246.1 hypothetical protein [Hydrogenophaga sp.]NIN27978.1 hypothetical protein [Hydrogenophaga sp.]NIN32756.1 hypothetical protein [Hydrogenophaga sp.]NIN54645.1 hypothetical protein [Hydrogenophaga sp.]NIO51321.1 hypothetical protein [Hydrogenophaga sp.]
MPSLAAAVHRLWQPRKGLFWLVLGFQALSSALVLFIQIHEPPAGVRLALGLLALTNTLLSWWLALRLWREGAPAGAAP